MSGNVWEWCQDWYDEHFYTFRDSKNTPEQTSAAVRVGRGGCWGSSSASVRSTNRHFYVPAFSSNYIGFRIAFTCLPKNIQ